MKRITMVWPTLVKYDQSQSEFLDLLNWFDEFMDSSDNILILKNHIVQRS